MQQVRILSSEKNKKILKGLEKYFVINYIMQYKVFLKWSILWMRSQWN